MYSFFSKTGLLMLEITPKWIFICTLVSATKVIYAARKNFSCYKSSWVSVTPVSVYACSFWFKHFLICLLLILIIIIYYFKEKWGFDSNAKSFIINWKDIILNDVAFFFFPLQKEAVQIISVLLKTSKIFHFSANMAS